MIKSKAIKANRINAAMDKLSAEKKLGDQWFNERMNTQDIKQLCAFAGLDFKMVDHWASRAAHDEARAEHVS